MFQVLKGMTMDYPAGTMLGGSVALVFVVIAVAIIGASIWEVRKYLRERKARLA